MYEFYSADTGYTCYLRSRQTETDPLRFSFGPELWQNSYPRPRRDEASPSNCQAIFRCAIPLLLVPANISYRPTCNNVTSG